MVNNEMFLLDPVQFPLTINVIALLDQIEPNVQILLLGESDKTILVVKDNSFLVRLHDCQCSDPRFCKQQPAAPNLQKYFMFLAVLTKMFLVSF